MARKKRTRLDLELAGTELAGTSASGDVRLHDVSPHSNDVDILTYAITVLDALLDSIMFALALKSDKPAQDRMSFVFV